MNNNINEQNRLLSPWAYFGYNFLFSLPLIGFILLIIYSLDDSNLNRRNYARSFWCSYIFIFSIIAFIIIFGLIIGFGFSDIINEVNSAVSA